MTKYQLLSSRCQKWPGGEGTGYKKSHEARGVFLVTAGMVVGDGIKFQGSRDRAAGSREHWSAFYRQGKMVIALSEPEKFLG